MLKSLKEQFDEYNKRLKSAVEKAVPETFDVNSLLKNMEIVYSVQQGFYDEGIALVKKARVNGLNAKMNMQSCEIFFNVER